MAASEQADQIFHSSMPLEKTMAAIFDLMKTMSNRWVAEGLVK